MFANNSIQSAPTLLSLSLAEVSQPVGYRTMRGNKRAKFDICEEYIWGKKLSPEFASELLENSWNINYQREHGASGTLGSAHSFNLYHPPCHPNYLKLEDDDECTEFYFNLIQARHMYDIHNNIPRWYKSRKQSKRQMPYQMWLVNNEWSGIISLKYPDLCPCIWNGFGLGSCPCNDLFATSASQRDRLSEPCHIPIKHKYPESIIRIPPRSPLFRDITSANELNQILVDPRIVTPEELFPITNVQMRGGRMLVHDPENDRIEMESEYMAMLAREDADNDMAAEAQLRYEARLMLPPLLIGENSDDNSEDVRGQQNESEDGNNKHISATKASKYNEYDEFIRQLVQVVGGQTDDFEDTEKQEIELEGMDNDASYDADEEDNGERKCRNKTGGH